MIKGSSIYYATDKNIYDALNQSKVDAETIQTMFRRRNIVCSKLTKREELARFFSRLPHDYLDHQDLSNRLGINPRRERVTAVDLLGKLVPMDATQRAIDTVKSKLESEGDTVRVNQDGCKFYVSVSYSIVDYKRSEFSQLQHRTGVVELIPESDRYVIRSPKSDYLEIVRDKLVQEILVEVGGGLIRKEISLYEYPLASVRSKFFYDLMSDLPGFYRRDVTDVYVYKPLPDEDEDGTTQEEIDPHVERVMLKGVGVSQSDLLNNLTRDKEYYIVKVGWIAQSVLAKGAGFDIEAAFSNPRDCTGFSYILRGVYDLGEGNRLSKTRRSPSASEADVIAKVIEQKARELLILLANEDAVEASNETV
ncbi:hypothetical protein [Hydrogenophaga sp. 5NK40-0174]|uniref:hypothetical protein n=1 Tax=Hydrogenophaga sp. 5NK40-0174 TaxID=3127649 RepID=UPI0031088FA3